jgi:DnaJ-class molecular chaperone
MGEVGDQYMDKKKIIKCPLCNGHGKVKLCNRCKGIGWTQSGVCRDCGGRKTLLVKEDK